MPGIRLTVEETGETSGLKIAFDGCDQVDQRLNAYKSAGGIHTKEKIIARMAEEYVLLADETKIVKELGYDIPIVLDIVRKRWDMSEEKFRQWEDAFDRGTNIFWKQNLKGILPWGAGSKIKSNDRSH